MTVTTYVVQVLLDSGDWYDASERFPDLVLARSMVSAQPDSQRDKFRIIERRVTTVEEVMP